MTTLEYMAETLNIFDSHSFSNEYKHFQENNFSVNALTTISVITTN